LGIAAGCSETKEAIGQAEEGREEVHKEGGEMTKTKFPELRREGDGWVVEYERLKDGVPLSDKWLYASKAEAGRQWMKCLGLYLEDSPEDEQIRLLEILAPMLEKHQAELDE
jgi:hypothetical protein